MGDPRAYAKNLSDTLIDTGTAFQYDDSDDGLDTVLIGAEGDPEEKDYSSEDWSHPAILFKPSDPDGNDKCKLLIWRSGDELTIIGGREVRWQVSIEPGEVVIRGLAENSGHIKLKTDGTIEVDAGSSASLLTVGSGGETKVGAGDDYVALAAKVDSIISDIHSVFNAWIPVPNDGGGKLQIDWKAKFGTPPTSSSVASSNLKAD